jgi:predicted Zn-dependent protease
MVTLTINNQKVVVSEDTTILEAARQINVNITHPLSSGRIRELRQLPHLRGRNRG